MAKQISHYICQECGFESPKWEGQCSGCNKWNSFVETLQVKTKGSRGRKSVSGGSVIKLSQVKAGEIERVRTGIGELDRVLGEGLVPGSVMLLAGEPGIGKSTLLTQLATRLKNVLYVCGEESPSQVKLRVDRLKVGGESLLLLPETDTDVVVGQIGNEKNLGLVIVDSIQTMQTGDLSGMAGSVGQIRESANRLIEICKKKQIPLVLVGHVTKEGSIAGPKVLEHMVDVVLTLEGDKQHDFRILRGGKNRFGAVDEVGVFSMGERGLVEVKNPSGVFLDETGKSKAGSVVVPVMAGLRPICVEIQALVVPTQLAVPRRVSTGVDQR